MITINSTERLILNAIVFFVRDGKGVQEAITCRLFLFECYQKLTTLHDTVRYELAMRDFDEALTEIESLLLRAYHGKEDADGGDEDLGDP